MQRENQRRVRFEIMAQTRGSLEAWIEARGPQATDFLFPSRMYMS